METLMNESDPEDTAYYFKDGVLVFTEAGRRHFTAEERGELEKLYVQLGKKFDDICAHVATTFGYGTEVKSLPEDVVEKIAGEADELIENWESDVEMNPDQWEKASRPAPGIQQLLAEHHELSERILDIQDEALGRESGEDT
jgi:hypothetical protein